MGYRYLLDLPEKMSKNVNENCSCEEEEAEKALAQMPETFFYLMK